MQFQITPCSSTFAVSVKLTSVFKSLWNGGQPRLQTAGLYKAHSIEARLKYQQNKVLIIFPPPRLALLPFSLSSLLVPPFLSSPDLQSLFWDAKP